MKLSEVVSKERVINGLKSLGKMRVRTSHSSVITFSALILILFVAFAVRIFPLRWEIQTGAMHLSEFDPYYQFSLTKYMVENGLLSPYWPTHWVDTQRWYPDGINMAMSYPSLPMTAAFLYNIVTSLGVNIDLMGFCALFPAIMGTLACFIMYFVGKDIGGRSVGLFASLFLALSPSYIQRTSLGFFDDETIGMVALLLFCLMFLRAIEEERPIRSTIRYSIGSALALAYFISGWGAAFYPIGLAVLFVFVMILLKRYSRHILLSYSITFGLGLLIAINVPYISPRYLTAFAVLPVGGLFALLCLCEILSSLTSFKAKATFAASLLAGLAGGFVVFWQLGYMQNVAGKFISVINPFERGEFPLIESVAEHRISAWGSMYYDFGIMIIFFAVSFYFILRNLTHRNLFLMIFGLTSLYFACSMVRLLVLMAPAFSLLAAVGILGVLKPFNALLREPQRIVTKKRFGLEHVGKEFSGTAVFLIFLILMTSFAFSPQSGGMPKVYRQSYAPVTITAGSLPVATQGPVREWLDMLDWMKSNLGSTTVVCCWWDYGYWLSLLGNVTSLADNATINSTQIENIGFAFMANETNSLKMLKSYNAKYILVFITIGVSQNQTSGETTAGYQGYGDEGKWMWMARISGKGNWADRIAKKLIDQDSTWENEAKFGQFSNESKWIWNSYGMNSTIYKLMSYGKNRWCTAMGVTDPDEVVQPQYFREAFFSGVGLSQTETQRRVSAYGGLVPLVLLYEIVYPTE
jgi:dolichyl-diphosphooligosaccharide--protein glycosyltransferase